MKNLFDKAVTGFVAATIGVAATPCDAQVRQGPINQLNAVDIERVVQSRPDIPPTFSITGRLSKNKDLSLEYKRYSDDYDKTRDMRLKWQITRDMDVKPKGIMGVRLTIKIK